MIPLIDQNKNLIIADQFPTYMYLGVYKWDVAYPSDQITYESLKNISLCNLVVDLTDQLLCRILKKNNFKLNYNDLTSIDFHSK